MIRYCSSDKSTDIDEYNPRVAISRFPYIFRKLSANIICALVWLFVTIVYRGHVRDHVIWSKKKKIISDTLKSSKFKIKDSICNPLSSCNI